MAGWIGPLIGTILGSMSKPSPQFKSAGFGVLKGGQMGAPNGGNGLSLLSKAADMLGGEKKDSFGAKNKGLLYDDRRDQG